MLVIKNEDISPFDVDNTLILDQNTNVDADNLRVDIWDPITKKFINTYVHEPMVRLLKEQKRRNGFVVVWSRGGFEWATNVVKALHLTEYVDIVMSKPRVYFDDLPVKKWLKDRVYLEPKSKYKVTNKRRKNGIKEL